MNTASQVEAPVSVERSSEQAIHPAALVGLGLCIAAFWMLQHPYEGIVHDSLLYAFQALARLHPESLSHDIWLSVGVQDRYSVFSPLAAALVHAVGLERAAQIVTLASQLAFFGTAWLLVRRLMPLTPATLSLGLLVVLPAVYGDRHIFSYVEPFMTPRLPAEGFALASLAAALGSRYILSGIFLVLSLVLHPLMAMAAVVLLFILFVGLRRPALAMGLVAAGFVLVVGLAWLAPFGPIARFSTGWWDLLYSRGEYLFPTRWQWLDWAHVTVPLTTLAVGALRANQPLIRSLCRAALLTGLGGVALAWVGGDLLHIILIVQGQPWRWLWLSNALAVMVIPVVALDCWSAGDAARIALVLLAASWVCIDESYGPLIGLLTVAAAAAAPRLKNSPQTLLLLFVAAAILAIGLLALAGFIASVMRSLAKIPPDPAVYVSNYLLALRHWKPLESGGIIPAAVLIIAWLAASRRKQAGVAIAVLALGCSLCAACAQFAWKSWTRIDYPESLHASFAPWREAIPPAAEVLWLAPSSFPVWYLIERPSYWSSSQMAASVFSEEMARRLALREHILDSLSSTGSPAQDLQIICKDNPALGFFVSPVDMGPTPFPTIVIENHVGAGTVRLYRCADHR